MIPHFVTGLQTHIGHAHAVTSKEIIEGLKTNLGITVTGPRVRAIIHHIRAYGLVKKLIATNNGYYIEPDPNEVLKYIRSLKQRENAIKEIRDTLSKQI
jgi:hypothetical protein